MTTSTGMTSEWTAAALRPTARWIAVPTAAGRARMEMIWAVPDISASAAVTDASAAA